MSLLALLLAATIQDVASSARPSLQLCEAAFREQAHGTVSVCYAAQLRAHARVLHAATPCMAEDKQDTPACKRIVTCFEEHTDGELTNYVRVIRCAEPDGGGE